MPAYGAEALSPWSMRTRSTGTPNVSAAIMAIVVSVPLMSLWPTWTTRLPSGSTRQPAAAGSRPPPQPPTAMPTPSPGPAGAL